MIALNVVPQAGNLRVWEAFWRRAGGGDVLFAEDIRGDAVPAFNVRTAGTKIIIDRKGQVVFREPRTMGYEQLRSAAKQAL